MIALTDTEPEIAVTVVYSPAPRQVVEQRLTLPSGSTLAQALQALRALKGLPALQGLQAVLNEVDLAQQPVGIWGRKAALNQALRNQDRIEIYRPLKVDPKVARRERFVKQGAKRKAGLFAQRRVGAKPGY